MTKLRNLQLETLLNVTTPAVPVPSNAPATPARKQRGAHGFSVHQRNDSRRPQTFVNRRRGK